jgi:hypothetical protein
MIIDNLREIVHSSSAKKIDGMLVDITTANAILTVYDNLSDTNKAKLIDMPLEKMAAVCWRLLERVK